MEINDIEKIVFDITDREISLQNTDLKIIDLGIDSLSYLELVVEVETRMGKEFPDNLIFNCNTVGDLLDLINKKII